MGKEIIRDGVKVPLRKLSLTEHQYAPEWNRFQRKLNLRYRDGTLFANTPEGRRSVKAGFENFVPVIYYTSENGKVIRSRVPGLDPDYVTRGGKLGKSSFTIYDNPNSSKNIKKR